MGKGESKSIDSTALVDEYVASLAAAPLCRFFDWPNSAIPRVCAGVYAVYDRDGRFIYIGMAGALLTESAIEKKKKTGRKSGLFDRLNAHVSGYRSGDRFNIYIGDLYVLGRLSQLQIQQISTGKSEFDAFIKKYIRDELSYRYLELPNAVVRELEDYIKIKGINGELPSINSKEKKQNE